MARRRAVPTPRDVQSKEFHCPCQSLPPITTSRTSYCGTGRVTALELPVTHAYLLASSDNDGLGSKKTTPTGWPMTGEAT